MKMDELVMLYESMDDPHIEYPFTKDALFKTTHEQVKTFFAKPKGNCFFINTNYKRNRLVYKFFIDGKVGREERDPKTGLILPACIIITEEQPKVVVELTWYSKDAIYDRKESDPDTGERYPQFISIEQKANILHREWLQNNRYNNEQGPAILDVNLLTNEIVFQDFYLDNVQMSEIEWTKERISRDDITDDDFLRGFGKIL